MHRAIRIDMDKGARLIEMGERERNAELDRRERNAFFQNRILLVESRDLLPPRPVAARFFQRLDNLKGDIVFNLLPVGRHIAPAPIEIALAHIERIKARFNRDGIHHPLGKHHALRPAKAAERRIGNRIGAQPPRLDVIGRIEIGIVRMEHGAVAHALAERSAE